MKIARHWAKGKAEIRLPSGKTFSVVAWGWSESTRKEAEQRAAQNAARAAQWLAENWKQKTRGQYYSVERPPREEIVQEIAGTNGEVVAIITRNSYGALVLNTAHLMFIDVDIPFERIGELMRRRVLGWLGRAPETPEERVQRKIVQVAENHRALGIRLYRTAAGFRLAVTANQIEPNSAQSVRLLEEFGADPLYITLCRQQECYRARLSPKFWRCFSDRPPSRFPWRSPEEEKIYRAWEQEYSARCENFATCRFEQQFGGAIDPSLNALVELHDQFTKATGNLQLA